MIGRSPNTPLVRHPNKLWPSLRQYRTNRQILQHLASSVVAKLVAILESHGGDKVHGETDKIYFRNGGCTFGGR